MAILKRLLHGLGIAVLTACLPVARVSAAGTSLEYEVKAAFLYNFIKFTDWPADAFQSDADPFRICLVDNPFGDTLAEMTQGDTVGARRIVVEALAPAGSDAATDRCQLLFVSKAVAAPADGAALPAGPTLLVGESDGFLERGGVINFVIESGRVRFDISPAAAQARGLTISSKLLRVARNTKEP